MTFHYYYTDIGGVLGDFCDIITSCGELARDQSF